MQKGILYDIKYYRKIIIYKRKKLMANKYFYNEKFYDSELEETKTTKAKMEIWSES